MLSVGFGQIKIPDELVVVFSLSVVDVLDFVLHEGEGKVILFRVVVKSYLKYSLNLFQLAPYFVFDFFLFLLGCCYHKCHFLDLIDLSAIDHKQILRLYNKNEDRVAVDVFDAKEAGELLALFAAHDIDGVLGEGRGTMEPSEKDIYIGFLGLECLVKSREVDVYLR